jgi:hypothetical protein
MFGLEAFRVTKVSLCGPHSFDTSTLAPTAKEDAAAPAIPEPFFKRLWYFTHQVGRSGLRVCAEASTAQASQGNRRSAKRRQLFMGFLLAGRGLLGGIILIAEIFGSQLNLTWNLPRTLDRYWTGAMAS